MRPRPGLATLAGAVVYLAAAACRSPLAGDATGRRLVVMAPAAAEMIHALGLDGRVVGVGDFVTWPPELARRPRVGAYDHPSVETVVALRADLYVTALSRAGSPTHDRLRQLGVAVLELDFSTYDGTLRSLERLGEAVGRGAAARNLAAAIRRQVDDIRARAAAAPRRRVLVVVGRDPLYVAGPGSHLDELVAAGGGSNVANDARAPYQLMSLEVVLERLPEVILDTADNRPTAGFGRGAGPWAQWPFLPAVRQDRVYRLDPSRLTVPGPRLPAMALLVARMIHPEIFGEPPTHDLGPLTESGE